MTPTCADEAAFLAAIVADPADDTRRLVLADWLEERGGPGDAARAEFIRVGCESARVPYCEHAGRVVNWGTPMRACRDLFPNPHQGNGYGPHCGPCREFVRLRSRERDVRRWALPGWSLIGWEKVATCYHPAEDGNHVRAGTRLDVVFSRGFPDEVRLVLAAFLAHGPALARLPLTAVRLTDREPYYESPIRMGNLTPRAEWDALWIRAGESPPGRQRGPHPWEIPTGLWRLLPRSRFEARDCEDVDHAAHAALSVACLAHLAGLRAAG